MKKVGLITIYSVPNWGSLLQTYATQYIIEKIGYTCVIINYTRNNEWVLRHQPSYKYNPLKKILNKLGLTPFGRMRKKMDKFRTEYLNLSAAYNSLNELESNDWSDFTLMVTGSDQVWNPKFIYGDSVYMLSFVPEKIKKLSFSSSFAVDHLLPVYIDKYKKYLCEYASLSVREDNGKNIIENQLGINKNVKVLLDPTLLLSREEWLYSIPRSNFKKEEKYILYYMWDYAFDPKPYIYEVTKFFQDKYKYNIYALVGYKKPSFALGLKMLNKCDVSASQFIDLFNNADLIITSSFHGTAFALNFGKPLISVVPDNGDDRQSSLLGKLGLKKLAVKIGTDIKSINPFYDAIEEQRRLNILRKDSLDWIQSNFKEEI